MGYDDEAVASREMCKTPIYFWSHLPANGKPHIFSLNPASKDARRVKRSKPATYHFIILASVTHLQRYNEYLVRDYLT